MKKTYEVKRGLDTTYITKAIKGIGKGTRETIRRKEEREARGKAILDSRHRENRLTPSLVAKIKARRKKNKVARASRKLNRK